MLRELALRADTPLDPDVKFPQPRVHGTQVSTGITGRNRHHTMASRHRQIRKQRTLPQGTI